MLNSSVLTVNTEIGKREIFVSPILLHSKVQPIIKSGKIEILYFYGQMQDEAYKKMLDLEVLDEKFKSDSYIINCGQDFEKYYLGSMHLDFDTKLYWDWEGYANNEMSEEDVRNLAKILFDLGPSVRTVTFFTPTRPSDFNFIRK